MSDTSLPSDVHTAQSSNSNDVNLNCLELPLNIIDVDLELDHAINDFDWQTSSTSEEPSALEDRKAFLLKRNAERQRKFRERRKAEFLAANKQLEQTINHMKQLKLENKQISTINKAMQILQDYKERLIQLTTINENIEDNMTTAISMLNLQTVHDAVFNQFHHPPDIVIRTVISTMTLESFIENAKAFQARLAVLRCQLDQAPDDATRQLLEHRLTVVMSFRTKCWEVMYNENLQLLHELLLKASRDALSGQSNIVIDKNATSPYTGDSALEDMKSKGASISPHGSITFVFKCAVTSESRLVELSKQQIELLVRVCEKYEAKIQKARASLHRKVCELLEKQSVPIDVDDDPDEFIKKAIASHLSAAETMEVLKMEQMERNRAKLKLILDTSKLLTPIQFCDTVLGNNWTGAGFLSWVEVLCMFIPQISRGKLSNGTDDDNNVQSKDGGSG